MMYLEKKKKKETKTPCGFMTGGCEFTFLGEPSSGCCRMNIKLVIQGVRKTSLCVMGEPPVLFRKAAI